MTAIHRVLGVLIVGLFVVILVWAVVLRALGRSEAPTSLWVLQHWTENLLVGQILLGLIMLAVGRRVTGLPPAWLHYLYGSLFPFVAMVGGRIASLRRERFDYLGLAWGSFFAFGLTLRAIQTACGESVGDIARCLGL